MRNLAVKIFLGTMLITVSAVTVANTTVPVRLTVQNQRGANALTVHISIAQGSGNYKPILKGPATFVLTPQNRSYSSPDALILQSTLAVQLKGQFAISYTASYEGDQPSSVIKATYTPKVGYKNKTYAFSHMYELLTSEDSVISCEFYAGANSDKSGTPEIQINCVHNT